jgi:hypothetical protein
LIQVNAWFPPLGLTDHEAQGGFLAENGELAMSLRSLIPVGRDRGVAHRGSTDFFAPLQREIDRVFDNFTRGWPTFRAPDLTPSMDMVEIRQGDRDHRRTAGP